MFGHVFPPNWKMNVTEKWLRRNGLSQAYQRLPHDGMLGNKLA
jgi:hypothetical protein